MADSCHRSGSSLDVTPARSRGYGLGVTSRARCEMTTRTLGAPGHAVSWRQARAGACWIAFVAVHAGSAALNAAHGQLIAVKTAPIANGGQFAFLPSANLGLGGLSIALADSALDPFMNPA